ncbi:hypothetical protein BAE44_0002974, partial [Dichanthelium oligosanthes]
LTLRSICLPCIVIVTFLHSFLALSLLRPFFLSFWSWQKQPE